MSVGILRPDWDVPRSVVAGCTTRCGGVSRGVYASLNLAAHVGDDPAAVAENRRRLRDSLGLADEPVWLEQVHGSRVVTARPGGVPPRADGSVTRESRVVCAVLTADCLPVLLASRRGGEVAAVHAGWRGLADGVLAAALKAMRSSADELSAWIGPAIGQAAFEVGDEVRERFLAREPGDAAFFAANARGRWQADLSGIARRELESAGVRVFGAALCTHADSERFFSYRRDGECGRMASFVFLDGGPTPAGA